MKDHLQQLLCLLLAATMAMSMAACGEDGEKITEEPSEQISATTPVEPSEEENAASAEEDTNQTIHATLWDLTYDTADGWIYDEVELSDGETGSNLIIRIPGQEDEDLSRIYVTIQVEQDDPYPFRDNLIYYGFDEYEYEVNHAYPLTSVGGVDCLTNESSYWGTPTLHYIGRNEAAGISVL